MGFNTDDSARRAQDVETFRARQKMKEQTQRKATNGGGWVTGGSAPAANPTPARVVPPATVQPQQDYAPDPSRKDRKVFGVDQGD